MTDALHPRPNAAIALKASDKRRVKAFRLPWSYVADSICGYQGNADKFSIYRMSPGLLPEGFKIVLMVQEHPRNDMYFLVEHPSFPEVNSTEKIEAVEITIDEVDVHRADASYIPVVKLNPEVTLENKPKGFRMEPIFGATVDEYAAHEAKAYQKLGDLMEANESLKIPPIDVVKISHAAIQRNKNVATNLGAKQLLARSRAKGTNL